MNDSKTRMKRKIGWIVAGTVLAVCALALVRYFTRDYQVIRLPGHRNVKGLVQISPTEFLYLRDEALHLANVEKGIVQNIELPGEPVSLASDGEKAFIATEDGRIYRFQAGVVERVEGFNSPGKTESPWKNELAVFGNTVLAFTGRPHCVLTELVLKDLAVTKQATVKLVELDAGKWGNSLGVSAFCQLRDGRYAVFCSDSVILYDADLAQMGRVPLDYVPRLASSNDVLVDGRYCQELWTVC
jgi:hypothetical protein